MKLIKDIFVFLAILVRRNTLCKMGYHKMGEKTERLALGEELKVPACTVYGCGYINTAGASIIKPEGDGTMFAINGATGKLEGGVRVKLDSKTKDRFYRRSSVSTTIE